MIAWRTILDILGFIDFDFPRFPYTRSGRFHELDEFRFYSRFRLTKASALHFLILIEEEIHRISWRYVSCCKIFRNCNVCKIL
jgi:hypothetical protein